MCLICSALYVLRESLGIPAPRKLEGLPRWIGGSSTLTTMCIDWQNFARESGVQWPATCPLQISRLNVPAMILFNNLPKMFAVKTFRKAPRPGEIWSVASHVTNHNALNQRNAYWSAWFKEILSTTLQVSQLDSARFGFNKKCYKYAPQMLLLANWP